MEEDYWMILCNKSREQPEDWSKSEGSGRDNSNRYNGRCLNVLKRKLGNQGKI